MMQDKLFQFTTNQSCTATGVSTNSISIDSLSLVSGRTTYVEVQITESLAVANGVDHNSVRFEAILVDEADGAIAFSAHQVLGSSCEVHDATQAGSVVRPVGRAASAATGTAPAGSVRGLFTFALNPLTVEQIEAVKAISGVFVLNRIKIRHVVTNYAGAGLTAGKYSATLVLDAKSTGGVEQASDAVN